MKELVAGDAAPLFALSDGMHKVALSDFAAKTNVVVYFYPKNDTSGCTLEANDFQNNLARFKELNTEIIGISKDNEASHCKFRDKYSLAFPTLSDNAEIAEAYGVWGEKSMYGKKYMGIIRSTFLIDKNGLIVRIWRNVKVPNHVAEVIQTIERHL